MANVELNYETDTYRLQIGEGKWESPCRGFPVYQLINKITGLIEGESISLPDSIAFLLQRTLLLEEAVESFEAFGWAPEGPSDAYH